MVIYEGLGVSGQGGGFRIADGRGFRVRASPGALWSLGVPGL